MDENRPKYWFHAHKSRTSKPNSESLALDSMY